MGQKPYEHGYEDEDEWEDEFEKGWRSSSRPNRRLKLWIPILLGALLVFLGIGAYFVAKSPDQAVKRLQALSIKREITLSEAIKGGKDARLLLDTREYKYANFLMDMLQSAAVQPNLKVAILKELNESNQKFIHYDVVMEIYLEQLSQEADQEAIRILAFNQPQENERLFLKQTAHLLHGQEDQLLPLILKYKNDNVGAMVQVYELDLGIKFLAEKYSNKEISREDFKSFIRGKNTKEIVAVFYAQAKKNLEEGNYEAVRNLAAEPAQLAILVAEPYDEGFALMRNLVMNLEHIQRLKEQVDQIQNKLSTEETILAQQQEVTDLAKAEYEDQAQQLKKLQSSLGQYAPFELSGKIVNVLGEEATSYGTAQTYEGAYIRHNFFGEILSTERFLLRTYASSLKKEDSFTLEVIDSGSVEVQQENLMSTYQQRWPVYDEFTDEMKNDISRLTGSFQEAEAKTKEQKAIYDAENASLQTMLKEKAAVQEKIKQIQDQQEELTKEAEEFRVKVLAIQ